MKGTAKRYCLLAFGIAVMAAGIVIMVKAHLGTSPIAALPYVMSLNFSFISYGMFAFLWNIVLLLGQVVILRRDFRAVDLMQIPLSVGFGLAIDLFNAVFSAIDPNTYLDSVVVLGIGIVLLALGVACTIVSNTIMNCGEAFVRAITIKTGWNFGHTKVGFDLTLVLLAFVSSVVLLGSVQGVREGTLVAAAITGLLVNAAVQCMLKGVDKIRAIRYPDTQS